ncbi:MAG: hypothetical protein RMX97_05205 [Nostoc sp. DedQUE11]|nr:hypothetical protein [Nostoc sp. DedQUE11]
MEVKLGFGAIPKPQYVFVKKDNDYCWYMLSENDQKIPIYDKALTGVITEIEIDKQVETAFGEVGKIELSILADKPYIVRSGKNSYFSKSLLLSLNALTCEQLRNPLTISVRPGDSNVVFCNIYDPVTYRSVGVSWDGHKENNWQTIGQKVSLKINYIQNFNLFIDQTDRYLAQLNWTPEQGREYLQQRYGKRSRLQLTDTEIIEFIDYLKLELAQNC